MLNRIAQKFFLVALVAGSLALSAQNVNLPTIKVQGKEYYYYKVQGGDSPYGICKKFGWSEETLRECNTNFATKIKKGQTIYYPASPEYTPTVPDKKVAVAFPEAVTHTVARGETVYSIAALYGVPVAVIYANNPESRHSLKVGEKLVIVQQEYINGTTTEPFFYTVRQGDTLYGLAEKYNASVESLMSENPGISERNFKAGTTIRIVPNSRKTVIVSETKNTNTVVGFSQYKVQKNDTWESIAQSTGVSSEDLVSANPSEQLPKKGDWVVVPKMEMRERETLVEAPAVAETSIDDRDNIYNDVHHIDAAAEAQNKVDVAVVLEDPASKSNIDFIRGFIMGVDNLKNSGCKINLNVIDATKEVDTQDDFNTLKSSDLIIGVYENDFPAELANIGYENGIEVVNVFDTKSDLYQTNPSIVQLLQPIEYFNDLSTNYIYDIDNNAQLILLGDEDKGDKFAEALTQKYSPDVTSRLSVEEFAVYPFSLYEKYVVYCFQLKKDDIDAALGAIAEVQGNGIDILPVGRAQWVAFAPALSEKFGQTQVIVPSRFYANPSSSEQKQFNQHFHTNYNRNPYNSYPQYAMLGYDVARYFISTTAANHGDYNREITYRSGIQNDIEIRRLNNWSGFINVNGYILKYLPADMVSKIEIQ